MEEMLRDLHDLGSQVQRLRHKNGLTIEKLAKLSGVSSGFLSQLERGMANPSFLSLQKIASGLDVPISAFFQTSSSDNFVVRRDQRRKLVLDDANRVWQLLTPDLNRSIEFLLMEWGPGISTEGRPSCHEGEECGLVLEGTLEIHWGNEVFLLEEGDSIYLPSTVPHWYRNPSDKKVVCVWAATPPTW
ncbi:MAG: cupin domain-containing protein [Chloroflexi bacterium]|nr:MAG: cupin domain-containing protein [Chloroflexota bacterium]